MRNIRPTHLALACIGVGFLAILLAWNGAAGVSCVDCQIPYLLSGGAFGLALIGLGAGLLLFESGRRARAHLESKIDELIEVVRNGAPANGNGNGVAKPAGAVAVSKPAEPSANGMVVVGRSSFHLPNCRLVEGKDNLDYATREEAAERGLNPCRVCEPTRATAGSKKR